MSKGTVCIISSQVLSDKKIGGFGSMTWQLAKYLARNEWETKILVPRRKEDPRTLEKENIQLNFYTKGELIQRNTYESLGADIFHSQNQTLASSFANYFCPHAKHIVTCRDPRSPSDWVNEFRNATIRRKAKIPLNYVTEESFFASWAIKKADRVACPAKFLIPKIRKLYGLRKDPIFLPNLEEIPMSISPKPKEATVCWVGRFAKRKNPEGFIKLAGKFPGVRFLIAGKAEEPNRQVYLEKLMAQFPNLINLGYMDKFNNPEFYQMYNDAWVLINTASREGLPLTFIEAAGRGCAILSGVNPDNFSSNFGFWAKDKNFEEGLSYLINNEQYKLLGESAFKYVRDIYSLEKAGKAHEKLYEELLN